MGMSGVDSAPEVICLGETMVMFAPPPHQLIEYSHDFIALHGGSESNVAIGLERLGMHAGWIGKLPRNALGRKIVNEVRSYGVDTSAVVWTEKGRVGTFFVEFGACPRPTMTIYDRAGSAATTLEADDLDWEYISRAKWLHLTGITPASSETCRRSVREIAVRARSIGLKVSFDVNYRSLMWSAEEARETCGGILPSVSLLVATEADVGMLLGAKRERRDALKALYDAYSPEAVVMTLGGEGSLAYDGREFYRSDGYQVQPVNRLGAGDAFDAGLLFGYIRSGLQTGLDYGGAMAALKLTIPQNTPLINREDVEALLAHHSRDVVR